MLSTIFTPTKNLISTWFITLFLFIGIGGYSNYTQPIAAENTIELVISEKTVQPKTLSHRNSLHKITYFVPYSNHLRILSQYHHSIALNKDNEFDNCIILAITRKTLFCLNSNYTSEEDSFHIK